MNKILEKAKQIRCLITDLDGVLTNGVIYLDNHGNELKSFHVHDGVGLKLLMSVGIEVAVITTSNNELVRKRMEQIGVQHQYLGQRVKQPSFDNLCEKLNLLPQQCCYIGDDVPDLPIIRTVGLGVAVSNAVQPLQEYADWVTNLNGGEGAVREVCDLILKAQNRYQQAIERYYTL